MTVGALLLAKRYASTLISDFLNWISLLLISTATHLSLRGWERLLYHFGNTRMSWLGPRLLAGRRLGLLRRSQGWRCSESIVWDAVSLWGPCSRPYIPRNNSRVQPWIEPRISGMVIKHVNHYARGADLILFNYVHSYWVFKVKQQITEGWGTQKLQQGT